jgi:hypothetical protein
VHSNNADRGESSQDKSRDSKGCVLRPLGPLACILHDVSEVVRCMIFADYVSNGDLQI